MFREMLRKKQLLTQEECLAILKNEPRGVLSVLGDGRKDLLPRRQKGP